MQHMTTLREAAKQALEALEQLQGGCTDSDDGTVEAITVWCPEIIEALRTALAQQEQAPVAYSVGRTLHWHEGRGVDDAKLFASPPRREWRGLTDDEIDARWRTACADERPRTTADLVRAFARAVEQALKERNQ